MKSDKVRLLVTLSAKDGQPLTGNEAPQVVRDMLAGLNQLNVKVELTESSMEPVISPPSESDPAPAIRLPVSMCQINDVSQKLMDAEGIVFAHVDDVHAQELVKTLNHYPQALAALRRIGDLAGSGQLSGCEPIGSLGYIEDIVIQTLQTLNAKDAG